MLRKLAKYSLLSLSSFCFFTAVFQAGAYAQTSPPVPVPTPTPTPNHLIQPTEASTSFSSVKSTAIFSTPTSVPSPTSFPQHTPTPTNISTATPIPTTEPTITPSPAVQTNTNVIDADKLFSLVNAHRQSIGLHTLTKDEKTCQLATERAREIAEELATGTLHNGMYGRNLPYWNTENAIAYGSEEEDFNWWMSDSIHRQAIESKTHTISCVACSGIYCVQEFTSYQPK